MLVIKRDKSLQPFDIEKVRNAMSKAFADVGVTMPSDVTDCILDKYKELGEDDKIDIEDIQDEVEKCLMNRFPEVAKAYIIYRAEHKVLRENDGKLMRGIIKKLMATDVENQNANVDERSFGGRIGEASRVATKEVALKYILSSKTRRNHEKNEVYTHDLDSVAVGLHNCLSIPFDDLLSKGFRVRQTSVRPANSINTAMQLVAVIFQLQSLQQFGGVSATHLDWTMVPYVRKSFFKHYKDGCRWLSGTEPLKIENVEELPIDSELYTKNKKVYDYAMEMTKRELNQAVEGMYHNLKVFGRRNSNVTNIAA